MTGIAGVFGVDNAAEIVMRMLQAMQHRGQDTAGIASADDKEIYDVRGTGLVDHVFERTDFPTKLPGSAAIGHIHRRSGQPASDPTRSQPFVRSFLDLPLAVIHAGRLTNGDELRDRLSAQGAIFATKGDSETILHAIARSRGESLLEKFTNSFELLEGAWATMILTPGMIMVALDPLGYRPLSVAPYKDGFAIASETCALDLIDALPWTIVEPGTIVIATKDGTQTRKYASRTFGRRCSFESIYFTRPDSSAYGQSAHEVRARLGRALAVGETILSDTVTSVPDSSNAMASAYAHALGVEREEVLIRNHYMGAASGSTIRRATEYGARMKLGVTNSLAKDRTVTVVDDSLIHANSAKKVVGMLRRAGATKVHLRIASPPIRESCPFGVNEPDRKTLAAADRTIEQVREITGADSIRYLTGDELFEALGPNSRELYCTRCFDVSSPWVEPVETGE